MDDMIIPVEIQASDLNADRHRPLQPLRGERLFPHPTSRTYWVLTRLRNELEHIATSISASREDQRRLLVDFGCGDAPYRPLFESKVGRYVGCDLAGNAKADCILQQPDVLPFREDLCDIVLSTQVLEHVTNPAVYLNECARVLRPGGLLILSTHGVWKYHPDPKDLWRWTSAGLRKIIENAGFSVRSFKGILGPAAYGLQIWQDATLPKIPYRLQSLFIRFLQRRIGAADRACRPGIRNADASVYVVTACKAPGPEMT